MSVSSNPRSSPCQFVLYVPLLILALMTLVGCGGAGSGNTGGNPPPPPSNPVPAIVSLTPNSATASGSSFTLTITGQNFISSSTVYWNSPNALATTYVSSTQLQAQVTAADIASAGSATVSVGNPLPGGGNSGQVPAIFEGAFENDGVLVRIDILQRRRDSKWRLIEVKSSASPKEEYPEDVAIQYRVLSRCGLDVASCHLATVNRQDVFPGGDMDPWRFFRIRNVSRKVKGLQTKLLFQLRAEFRVLAMPTAPDLPTGKHCVQPVVCEFYDHCKSSFTHSSSKSASAHLRAENTRHVYRFSSGKSRKT